MLKKYCADHQKFIDEYNRWCGQAKELQATIHFYEAHEEELPPCDTALLRKQLQALQEYIHILEQRAQAEGIVLEDVDGELMLTVEQAHFVIDTLYHLGYEQYNTVEHDTHLEIKVERCGYLPAQSISLPKVFLNKTVVHTFIEHHWLPNWTPLKRESEFWAIHKPTKLLARRANDIEKYIVTLNGLVTANDGDYVITGVNGEQYPCDPEIFEKLYDRG